MTSFLKISPKVIIKFDVIDKFEANPKDVSLYVLSDGNFSYTIGAAHNNRGTIEFPKIHDRPTPRCFKIETKDQATSDYLLLRIIEECSNRNGIFEVIMNFNDPKDIFLDVRMCDSASYPPKSTVVAKLKEPRARKKKVQQLN